MTPTPHSALDFTDRRVAICGGSRGIGRAMALAFARLGARVSICARGADALAATRAELDALGAASHAQACDLGDGPSVQAYVRSAAQALGGLDVLVNNASGFGMGDDEAAWQAGLQVDVMGMVRASQAALPWLERSGNAAVINVTSISGFRASVRSPAYAAVKALMIQYTSTQAAQWAGRRIRVNAIAPGSVEFPGGLWAQRREAADPLYDRVLRGIPFGRMGTPEEVADVALFLASPLSRWMTGQTLVVDGGQLLGA